jgi:hypothetical protein
MNPTALSGAHSGGHTRLKQMEQLFNPESLFKPERGLW